MILEGFTKKSSYATVSLSVDEIRLLRKAVSTELKSAVQAVKADVGDDKLLSELKKRVHQHIPELSKIESELSMYNSLLSYGNIDERVVDAYAGYYSLEHELAGTDESE